MIFIELCYSLNALVVVDTQETSGDVYRKLGYHPPKLVVRVPFIANTTSINCVSKM